MTYEDYTYFHREDFRKKLAAYEEMTAHGTPVWLEAYELTDIADYYSIQGQKEKAQACIDYALRIHPGSTDPLLYIARKHLFNKEWEKAEKIINSIADRKEDEIILLQAELYLRQGLPKKAAKVLTIHYRRCTDDKDLLAYDCAQLYLDYDQVREARHWCDLALKENSQTDKFRLMNADILVLENQAPEAIKVLNGLLDDDPYYTEAWESLGEAYFATGDFGKAIESADFALAINEQSPHAIILKANTLYRLDDLEGAHQWYSKAISLDATEPSSFFFDAVTLVTLGRNDEAYQRLKQAEQLAQDDPANLEQVYLHMSDLLSNMGRPEEALAYLDKADSIYHEVESYLRRAHVYLQNHMTEPGMSYLNRYKQLCEDSCQASYEAGILLASVSMYTQARTEFAYVLQHATSPVLLGKSMAMVPYCHLMENNFNDFIETLHTVCEQDATYLKDALGDFFPEEVSPKEYYRYAVDHADQYGQSPA